MDRRRHGFTLVELLVVITIIGMLVGMLLPAVNAARESGRRAKCENNVHQLALACLSHLAANQQFPTGGWGNKWTGVPGRGFGRSQPGGWIYNILPSYDAQVLHDLEGNATGTQGSVTRLSNALAGLNCPTRRRALPFPAASNYKPLPMNTAVASVAKSDYVINGGSVVVADSDGPDSISSSGFTPPAKPTNWDGLSTFGSKVGAAHVTKGMSTTYLVGEKFLWLDYYVNGSGLGDQFSAYSGANADLVRWSAQQPKLDCDAKDLTASTSYQGFGSAHAVGWYVSFCDGSAKLMSFALDPAIHTVLSSRNSTTPVDQSRY